MKKRPAQCGDTSAPTSGLRYSRGRGPQPLPWCRHYSLPERSEEGSRVVRRHLASARRGMCALAIVCLSAPTDIGNLDGAGAISTEGAGVRQGSVWQVYPDPELDVGSLSSADQFSRVLAVFRLSEGRMLVVDDATRELRTYSPSGLLLRTAGGRGGGPGEFQGILLLRRFGRDSLLAFDLQLRRLSILDDGGNVARIVPFKGSVPQRVLGAVEGLLSNGNVVARWSSMERDADRMIVNDQIVVTAPSGETVGVLGDFVGGRIVKEPATGGGPATLDMPLFDRRTFVVTSGDRIFVGDNSSPDIAVYDALGRRRSIVRTSPGMRPISASTRRRAIAARLDLRGIQGPQREIEARAQDAMISQKEMPSYSAIVLSEEGLLWVREYAETVADAEHWRVYNDSGSEIGVVVMPDGFSMHSAGGSFVAGVWKDPDDVEHARVYRIRR